MSKTKETAPSELAWAYGAKPTTNEQITYINDCLESAEQDLQALKQESDSDLTERVDQMQGLVNMLKSIKENLIACLRIEQADHREGKAELDALRIRAQRTMPVDDDFNEVFIEIQQSARWIYNRYPDLKTDDDVKLFRLTEEEDEIAAARRQNQAELLSLRNRAVKILTGQTDPMIDPSKRQEELDEIRGKAMIIFINFPDLQTDEYIKLFKL